MLILDKKRNCKLIFQILMLKDERREIMREDEKTNRQVFQTVVMYVDGRSEIEEPSGFPDRDDIESIYRR